MGDIFAGRYEFVDPLGEGGMGAVWRVWDHRANVYRAAKMLRQVDATSLLRFMREQALRVEHPHVVTPLNWAGEDDRVMFTMPLVNGGSVATLCGDFGPLPRAWVATLLDQLFDALTTVHRAGVIHRDIKPANLLLKATGGGAPHLLLSDFGIAAPVLQPRLTHTDMVVGTRGYVAPEVAEKREDGPDPRQDLYAAGVTAVEMLTGSRADEVEPGRLDEIAGPLAGLIAGLTSPDPFERPSSAPQAQELLTATGEVPPPGTVPDDGRAGIEIFDQLPPLPDGWDEPTTPEMPRRETASSQPGRRRDDHPRGAEAEVSDQPPPPPARANEQTTHTSVMTSTPATSRRPSKSHAGTWATTIVAVVAGLALIVVAVARAL